MKQPTNTSLIQQAYAAFGRGDIPALLALLDENVDWTPVYGAGRHVPTGGHRQGRAAVGVFFQQIAQAYQFSVFEPREYVEQGDKVLALGHYTAKVHSTGRTLDSDWAMVFTLRNGKVVKFVEFTDSAAVDRAWIKV